MYERVNKTFLLYYISQYFWTVSFLCFYFFFVFHFNVYLGLLVVSWSAAAVSFYVRIDWLSLKGRKVACFLPMVALFVCVYKITEQQRVRWRQCPWTTWQPTAWIICRQNDIHLVTCTTWIIFIFQNSPRYSSPDGKLWHGVVSCIPLTQYN